MKNLILLFLAVLTLSCTTKAQEKTETKKEYKVTKTDAQWKEVLTSEQYYILRKAGTERPFSSPLNKNYKEGVYHCAGCNTPLYKSEHKFDSGTGWPSFDRAVEGSIDKDVDYKIGYARSELLCGTCGGHLGHVFSDGPRNTTGKRHCINGDALIFVPKK
ncbi:peptide-methionine (R)-S-oxide reductase MsrB [Aquimarina rhabdastrellae]